MNQEPKMLLYTDNFGHGPFSLRTMKNDLNRIMYHKPNTGFS